MYLLRAMRRRLKELNYIVDKSIMRWNCIIQSYWLLVGCRSIEATCRKTSTMLSSSAHAEVEDGASQHPGTIAAIKVASSSHAGNTDMCRTSRSPVKAKAGVVRKDQNPRLLRPRRRAKKPRAMTSTPQPHPTPQRPPPALPYHYGVYRTDGL